MPVPLSQTYGKEVPQYPPYANQTFRLEITRIIPIWPKRVYLQWLLRKPSLATGYVFNIFKSGSSEGPWEHIGVDLDDTYFFIDDSFDANYTNRSPDLMSLNRAVYYKVTVSGGLPAGTDSAEATKKMEAGLSQRHRGIHRKLQRDARIVLKKVIGTEVAILKRKWWGTPCTTCVNSTGQSSRAHCSVCYGTGIVDGYWAPVYGYAQRQRGVSPIMTQTQEAGKVDIHRIEVIMLNIPEVEHMDILAFIRDGKRYVVESVIPTQIHTVHVHQELQVSELARTASEYKIVVDPWHEPEWF